MQCKTGKKTTRVHNDGDIKESHSFHYSLPSIHPSICVSDGRHLEKKKKADECHLRFFFRGERTRARYFLVERRDSHFKAH